MDIRNNILIFVLSKQNIKVMEKIKYTALSDLSRIDWKELIDYGLVDGEGNGFANTTPLCDDLLLIGRNFTFIQIKYKIYGVRYISGCFYPVWQRYFAKPERCFLIKKDKYGSLVISLAK